MNFTRSRILYYIFFGGLVVLILLFFGGRYLVFTAIEKRIKKEINNLQSEGVTLHYDSLYTNPWKGNITLTGLHLIMPDTLPHDTLGVLLRADLPEIRLQGLAILPLLLRHTITIHTLSIPNSNIEYAENFKLKTRKKGDDQKLSGIIVNELTITNGHITKVDSVSHSSIGSASLSVTLTTIALQDINTKALRYSLGTMKAKDIVINFPKKFYTLKVKQAIYHARQKLFKVDSFALLPDFDKHRFAQKSIYQIDRIYCSIPSLQFTGCEINRLSRIALTVRKAKLNLHLEIFRDKRYPSLEQTSTLPVKALRTMALDVQIDTLLLTDSYIQYEEHPEEGDKAGKIFFNQLQASLYNLSNTSSEGARMETHANFMDAGVLSAQFTFPAQPEKSYHVNGTLKNFNMPSINLMLQPLINTKITSGTLQEMKFNFHYNNYRADGGVLLNYTNLKMESKKINQKNNFENKIITLLLNTFIKDNMDKHTATEKKTGTILFYRDQHRSIFNYWWKSILSGIKSVYNLDKIMNTSHNKPDASRHK